MDSLAETTAAIVAFRDERDWAQFHTPRNLAAALAIEAAELQEAMLWKTDSEVTTQLSDAKGREQVVAELGDVLIFSLLLCKTIGIDPIPAIRDKLLVNAAKYPVHLAKGSAAKYTELHEGR